MRKNSKTRKPYQTPTTKLTPEQAKLKLIDKQKDQGAKKLLELSLKASKSQKKLA